MGVFLFAPLFCVLFHLDVKWSHSPFCKNLLFRITIASFHQSGSGICGRVNIFFAFLISDAEYISNRVWVKFLLRCIFCRMFKLFAISCFFDISYVWLIKLHTNWLTIWSVMFRPDSSSVNDKPQLHLHINFLVVPRKDLMFNTSSQKYTLNL